MDSPLTTAELSRLRKAIHQRERLLSQGLSAAAAELNISRALSNLKLYLSQSQPQLGAVLKDWDGADQVKKDQIVAWLKQNVLNEKIPQVALSISTPPTQGSVSQSKFVAPPPPPPLPNMTNSSPPQSQPVPYQHAYYTISSPDISTQKAPSSVLPSPPLSQANSFTKTQLPITTPPPRNLYTQAVLKPPTPPPKDNHFRSASLARSSSFAQTNQPSLRTQGLPTSTYSSFSASPVSNTFSPRPDLSTSVSTTRPSLVHHPQSGNSNNRGATYPQTIEPNPPRSHLQHPNQHVSIPLVPGATNPSLHPSSIPSASLPTSLPSQSQPDSTMQIISQLAAYKQQHLNLLAQTLQTPASASPPASSPNYLLEAIKKYQAYRVQSAQSQSQMQSQLPPQQPTSGSDSIQQIMAAYQQQQQQQTDQTLALLQQQQQSIPSVDPSQYLAQSQQQNQDFANMVAQIQANTPGAGFDWSSLAGGSGLDVNSLMGGAGGAGVDWASVASMMMGGSDPTAMAGAVMDAGLF